jgi:hypothetical protein
VTSPARADDRHEPAENPIVLVVVVALLACEVVGVTFSASSGFPKPLALVVAVLEEEVGNVHGVVEPLVTQQRMKWVESESRCGYTTETRHWTHEWLEEIVAAPEAWVHSSAGQQG